MPSSASGTYSLPLLRFQEPPGLSPRGGQTLKSVLADMGDGIRTTRIQSGGGGGGGTGSITTGQIASFTACVGDVLATAIVAGNGMTVSAGTHLVELKISAVATSLITSFTACVGDAVGVALVAGTNISLSINATTHRVEIINTAALSGTITVAQILSYTESVQDIVGAFLVAGTNINFTYSDTANQLTINATASGGAAATLTGLTFTATGSGATAVSALEKMRQFTHVEDFGAVGDGVTDDSAAIMRAINAQPDLEGTGVTVYFGPRTYQCASTLNLKRTVHMIGTQGLEGDGGTRLRFPQGVDGIIFNHDRSHGPTGTLSGVATLSATTGANGSLIDGIWIAQDATPRNFMVLDADTTRNLVLGRTGGNCDTISASATVTVVSMQDDGDVNFTFTFEQQYTSHCTLVVLDPPTSFTTSETVVGSVSGTVGIIRYISPRWPTLNVEITVGTSFTRTDVLTGAVSGAVARCWSIGSSDLIVYRCGAAAGPPQGKGGLVFPQSFYGSGVRFRTRAHLARCHLSGWAFHGAIGAHSVDNMNLIRIHECSVSVVGADGFMLGGTDVNACTIMDCTVNVSGGWGIRDGAFLGNHHYSNHVSGMGAGPYRTTGTSGAFSVWSGCYSEGGGGNFPFYEYVESHNEGPTIIGGDHGAPIAGFGQWEDAPGSDGTASRPGQFIGRAFLMGRAIDMPGNLSPSGLFDSTTFMRFRNASSGGPCIDLTAASSRGDSSGALQWTMDLNDNEARRGEVHAGVTGGGIHARWNSSTGDGTFLRFTARSNHLGSYCLTTTKTSTYTGSGAVFLPIISGGLCVGVEIVHGGHQYNTLPPKIVGLGGLASICATCQVYGGEVISAGLVAGTTFTATSNDPMQMLDMSPGFLTCFVHSTGSSYELSAERLGSTASCDLFLNPKNGGRVMFGTFTSSAVLTVTGYIEIKDAAGNTRRLAVVA